MSEYVKRHFLRELVRNKNYGKEKFQAALKETFLQMDVIMQKPEGQKELKDILKGSEVGWPLE